MTRSADALVTRSEDQPNLRGLWRGFRRYYGTWLTRATFSGVLTGIVAVIELFVILMIALLGSAAIEGSNALQPVSFGIELTRSQLAVFTIAAVIIRGVVDVLAKLYAVRVTEHYEAEVRVGILRSFTSAEWDVQSEQDSADFVNSTYTYLSTSVATLSNLGGLVTALMSFVVMLVGSFAVGGLWTLAIVVLALLLGVAFRPLRVLSHRAGVHTKEATRSFGERVWDTVGNALEVRIFNVAEAVEEANSEGARAMAAAGAKQQRLSDLLNSLYTTISYSAAGLALVVVVLVRPAHPAQLVAVIMLLYRSLGYGSTLQSLHQKLITSVPQLEAVEELRDRLDAAALPTGGEPFEHPLHHVRFDQVSFTYPDGTPGLEDVSLQLDAGQAIGVVGPSGAGKSTFVQLLLRLRLPTSGMVRANDQDLVGIDPTTWFGRAVLVTQNPRMFNATVLENVRAFRSGISDADVRSALSAARVLDEIDALPDGLLTEVGEDRLSGGQRQRVALARALVGHPEVLVLDEPTSALDLPSEDAIRETLLALKGDLTLIIVAHRLSTLRVCDRILVFERGRIEADGSRAELESDNEFFAKAVELAQLS